MNTLASLHKVHLKIQFGAVESGADRGSDEVKDWESEGVGSRESFLSFIMKPIHNPFIWDTGEKLHGAFLSITNQTNYPELSWRTEIYSVFYHVPSAYIQQTTTGYIRYLQDCRCFKYSQHPELSKKVKHNHTKVNERHLKYQKIEIKKKAKSITFKSAKTSELCLIQYNQPKPHVVLYGTAPPGRQIQFCVENN